MIIIRYSVRHVKVTSAAEMLAAARKVHDEMEKRKDFPGKERFMREVRNRLALLERRAKEEAENG